MTAAPRGIDALRHLYQEVAPRYELVNHLLTLGLDIGWRRRAARMAGAQQGSRWLDLACGTGEMGAAVQRAASGPIQVTAFDLSIPMLARARRKGALAGGTFACGESAQLPFPPATFAGVAIGFAARNLNTPPERFLDRLRECLRVLVPGGRLIVLETSQPESRLWRWLFHRYVALTVRPLGRAVSGSARGYGYLAATIPRFYRARELEALLFAAGAARVTHLPLLGGVAALHLAEKGRRGGIGGQDVGKAGSRQGMMSGRPRLGRA